MTNIWFSAVLAITIIADAKAVFETVATPDHPGIFYERLPDIRVTTTDWKIVTYLDIQWLISRQPWGSRQIEEIIAGCKEYLGPAQCRPILSETRFRGRQLRISNLKGQIDSLTSSSVPMEGPKRPKTRGAPLAFVGTISNALFGTLAEEDAERYNHEIVRLEKTGSELTHLVHNATHVIRGAINRIDAHTHALAEEFETLRRITNEIQKNLFGEIQEIHRLNYTAHLLCLSSNILDAADNYIDTLQRFTDAIRFLQLGLIHPDVLSVDQLTTAARHARQSMPSLGFPLTINDLRNSDLTTHSRLSTSYQQGRLIVRISLPLLEEKPFHVHRMYPCLRPQNHEGKPTGAAYIQPRHPYLAWSNEQGKYFMFEESYLKLCYPLPNGYACPLRSTLRDIHEDACEARLLVSPANTTLRGCDIRVTRDHHSQWTFLEHTQGWLYSLDAPVNLRIQCANGTSRSVTLQNTGIIQLLPGCTGYAPHTTLPPSSSVISTIDGIHWPLTSLNISDMSLPIADAYRRNVDPLLLAQRPLAIGTPITPSDTSLAAIEAQLDFLEKRENEVNWYQKTRTWTFGGIGFTVLTLTSLVIYMTPENQSVLHPNPFQAITFSTMLSIRNAPVEGLSGYYRVRINKIDNPHRMWVSLADPQYRQTEWETEMRRVANNTHRLRRLSEEEIHPGAPALWRPRGDQYIRVTCLDGSEDPRNISVYCGDHAVTSTADFDDLWELSTSLRLIPWIIIPCGQAGIRPRKALSWSLRSSQDLQQFVGQTASIRIVRRDETMDAVWVDLTLGDGNSNNDHPSLAGILRAQGHARYTRTRYSFDWPNAGGLLGDASLVRKTDEYLLSLRDSPDSPPPPDEEPTDPIPTTEGTEDTLDASNVDTSDNASASTVQIRPRLDPLTWSSDRYNSEGGSDDESD